MKFTILFVIGLVAHATAGCFSSSGRALLPPPPPGVSEEGIYHHLNRESKAKLEFLKKLVAQIVSDKVKDILTDGIQISPTKEVIADIELAGRSNASLESAVHVSDIIEATGDLILKRAGELAAQRAFEPEYSHERLTGFGDISVINEIEERLQGKYNGTVKYGGPSHEGIIGGLGAITIGGLPNLIGRQHYNQYPHDIIFGHVFYVAPRFPISKEGIIPVQSSEEGILSSAGKLILKGAAKFAGEILYGVFGPVRNILQNIFLARGSFSDYPNIQAAAHELILQARHNLHHFLHPEAQHCLNVAEHNFSLLFNNYLKDGQTCVASAQPHGKRIINHVQDIVLDAVRRVEDAHREIEFCLRKVVEENRVVCLDKDLSSRIEEHTRKIEHYGEDLADFVKQFSDLNTGFDVCLVNHLGIVRREIYHIVYDFHRCVNLRSTLANN